MIPAADVEEYRANPAGTYVVIPRALVFCTRPTLWGFSLWGTDESDLRRVVPLLSLELTAVPHASLVDVRRLESGDPRAFAVLTRYLRTNFETFRTCVTRLALVRPPGLLGATVAGFYQVAGSPYPVRVFDDLRAAGAWLRAPEATATLEAAVEAASGMSPVLLKLRRWLDGHLDEATLARAARARIARDSQPAARPTRRSDLVPGRARHRRACDSRNACWSRVTRP